MSTVRTCVRQETLKTPTNRQRIAP
jgi:hypothetical protein